MSERRRIDVREVNGVQLVRCRDQNLIKDIDIQEWGRELFRLVEINPRILINFSGVDYMCSMALGKLMTLDKRVKVARGRIVLSNLKPEIYEVFMITKLNRLFDIKDDEDSALALFG